MTTQASNTRIATVIEAAVNGFINLGYENGWTSEDYSVYAKLRELRIPDSAKVYQNGPCESEITFKIEFENKVYDVRYRVDTSG